ncbi:MAG: iron-sulfur cluster assembly protein [Salinivirgaceae bacterium]|nr:iron-sulfur cluster assembly protein [Salinivirgaceae bacterium]MDD4747395.1 iron-sulfur cluster assembly protein [Salinivirgaceae bacterium]MDY0280351.1 iron-sulfur cluster assembly protein [Salinivirgaceae bacterium]
MSEINDIEEKVNEVLKTIFDPEIPVNIYDLGLIYKVEVDDDSSVMIEMTLTAPNCPMAGDILDQVKERVELIDEVSDVFVNLTFDPPWDPERMTDEAKLELGFL